MHTFEGGVRELLPRKIPIYLIIIPLSFQFVGWLPVPRTFDHGVGIVNCQTFVAIFEEVGPDADIGPCDCCYPRDYGTSILVVRNIRIIV